MRNYLSNDIVCVEYITALRAELGRLCGIVRLPSALITFEQRSACRLGRATLLAELALVLCAA